MANQILIKRGTGTSTLANGELAYNTSTNILYIGNSGNKAIGGSGAFLPLSGGTVRGEILIKNSTDTGLLRLYGSAEGGNIQIQGPANTHYWEMDALKDSQLRLYCHDIENATNSGFWVLNSSDLHTTLPGTLYTTGITSSGAISASGKVSGGSMQTDSFFINGGTSETGDIQFARPTDYSYSAHIDSWQEHLRIYTTDSSNSHVGTPLIIGLADGKLKPASPLDIEYGGTGATDATTARSNLGITPANIGALSLTGGTMSGTLTIQNSLSSGYFKAGNDEEGGFWEVKCKDGSYSYQFDDQDNDGWRLYAWDNTTDSYAGDITFSVEKKRLNVHRLYLAATEDASETASNDVALRVGPSSDQHLDIDCNEILSKTNDSTMGSLFLQGLELQASGTIATGTWNGTAVGIAYGGTGATSKSAARTALEVPYFHDGIIDLDNLQGIGTSTNDGMWWKFWNWAHTDSEGTTTYPVALLPTKDGVQNLGLSNYRIANVYANNYPCGTWNGDAIAVAKGGTGATTAAAARTNLGAVNIAGDTMTGTLIIKPSGYAGSVKLWTDGEGGNISLSSKSGTYHYQWDGNYDSYLRFFCQNTAGDVLSNWFFHADNGRFTTKVLNVGSTTDIAGITYSSTEPSGSAGKIWLKPI